MTAQICPLQVRLSKTAADLSCRKWEEIWNVLDVSACMLKIPGGPTHPSSYPNRARSLDASPCRLVASSLRKAANAWPTTWSIL